MPTASFYVYRRPEDAKTPVREQITNGRNEKLGFYFGSSCGSGFVGGFRDAGLAACSLILVNHASLRSLIECANCGY